MHAPPVDHADEELLTIDELCARIKYKKQSIYNLIHRGKFLQGKHYVKPRGKLLFIWHAILEWLGLTGMPADTVSEVGAEDRDGNPVGESLEATVAPVRAAALVPVPHSCARSPGNRINI